MNATRQFWCDTCQIKEPMDAIQFKEHLKTVHGLEGKVSGRKTAVSFLDGEGGWFQQTYEWHLPGVKALEVAEGKTGHNYP